MQVNCHFRLLFRVLKVESFAIFTSKFINIGDTLDGKFIFEVNSDGDFIAK